MKVILNEEDVKEAITYFITKKFQINSDTIQYIDYIAMDAEVYIERKMDNEAKR